MNDGRPLTLSEFINEDPSAIVSKVSREVNTDFKPLRKALKGLFADFPHNIKVNHKFDLLDKTLQITKVIKATGRVFFAIEHDDQEFSTTRDYLTGEVNDFPYKKGDTVAWVESDPDLLWLVVGLVKSSKRIKIQNGDISKVVPMNQVTLVDMLLGEAPQ